MSNRANKVIKSLAGKRVGVFVDDSNLYHAYWKRGWRVDFKKFKEFLEPLCNLQFIHYHLAIPHKNDSTIHGTSRFLKNIEPFVTLKNKELKYTPVAGKFVKKADVDVEITLDVVRKIDDLDAVIIVSGDSDYLALKDYVTKDKKKIVVFFAYEKSMAWELKYCWHLFLDDYEKELRLEGWEDVRG